MYSDALNEDLADLVFRRCVDRLKEDLLAADQGLKGDRALRIARRLCSGGWYGPECGGVHPPGIPAADIMLETRLLLRSSVLAESGRYTREEALELASRFSSEGALILDLRVGDDKVWMEFLTTVEQAMFALAPMRSAAQSLALWLRSAGYAGAIEARVRELAGMLEEKHVDPSDVDGPMVLLPLSHGNPASWN